MGENLGAPKTLQRIAERNEFLARFLSFVVFENLL